MDLVRKAFDQHVVLAVALLGGLGLISGPLAAEEHQVILGTITVDPALADRIEPQDRLIIKLYHPGDGVELDAKYQILTDFELPLAFTMMPSIDMNGRTKFNAYVIEVFTDKDDDVLAVAEGELAGRTPEPVPLGTKDLEIRLDKLRE